MKNLFTPICHPRVSDARFVLEDRVITATLRRAHAELQRVPLTGDDPLHNDERLCLFRVKRAIKDFFNQGVRP